MNDQEREKRQLLDAILPHVMFDGWSGKSVRLALADLGLGRAVFNLHFPDGMTDLISFFIHKADEEMEAELEKRGAREMKIRDRITLAIRLRLELYEPWKDAVRKAITFLALPQNTALGLRLTAGTVSRMWYATGDTSVDFSYYTKRLTLSAVYGATLLYWLDDPSEGHQKSWEFLDRRIENVMQVERAKFRARRIFSSKPDFTGIPSPARFFRNLRAR
jgi:ubiquinone biosynthesis protein COQ9